MRIVVSACIFCVLKRSYTVGTLYGMVLHVNGVADVRKREKNEQTPTNTSNSCRRGSPSQMASEKKQKNGDGSYKKQSGG